jgi:hypothetical protein
MRGMFKVAGAWALVANLVYVVGAVRGADAGEVLYADGRRAAVGAPRADAKGHWTGEFEGRRVPLRPGDVVVVVDDAGTETVLIPPTLDTPDAPEVATMLASLRDPKDEGWPVLLERLCATPTKTVQAALEAMAADPKKPLRQRAIQALMRLRTREGTLAAAKVVLAEADRALRRESASALFAVEEIFRRCDGAAELVAQGLRDPEREVRFVFAMLAAQDDAAAITVLVKDGLGHTDHHVRESAALELGRRGNVSGERILIGLIDRTKLDISDDPELNDRLLAENQVDVCGVLGTFHTQAATAALQKAKKSKFESVRAAAERALAAATAAK